MADGDADGVSRIDMGAFEVLRGDLNGDGQVSGLDVTPFVSVLLAAGAGGDASADMNADGSADGLDVDPFVEAVFAGSLQRSVPDDNLAKSDAALAGTPTQASRNRIAQVHAEPYGEYLLSTRSDARREKLFPKRSHRTLDLRATARRATVRRFRTGPLVSRDGDRSPGEEMQHNETNRWQAAVDHAFNDNTGWIGTAEPTIQARRASE